MKQLILLFATIFGILGVYVPTLWGDTDILSSWSILTGTIGGIIGIWVGVVIAKRWGG